MMKKKKYISLLLFCFCTLFCSGQTIDTTKRSIHLGLYLSSTYSRSPGSQTKDYAVTRFHHSINAEISYKEFHLFMGLANTVNPKNDRWNTRALDAPKQALGISLGVRKSKMFSNRWEGFVQYHFVDGTITFVDRFAGMVFEEDSYRIQQHSIKIGLGYKPVSSLSIQANLGVGFWVFGPAFHTGLAINWLPFKPK